MEIGVNRFNLGVLVVAALASSLAVGQAAPVPEFFGIYGTTDGKLIPLTGGRGTVAATQRNQKMLNFYDMKEEPQKVLSVDGSDLRFTVYDASVADLSASIELYKIPFARNRITHPDALGQLGSLYGQPQSKPRPESMQEYVIAKTDAYKVNLLQKPVPGQAQMIQLVPEAPLQSGLYALFSKRSQGLESTTTLIVFAWNSPPSGSNASPCIDLAVVGGYGGMMQNHDLRIEHPYYLPKEEFAECGAQSGDSGASLGAAGITGASPGSSASSASSTGALNENAAAACGGYSTCFDAGLKAYQSSDTNSALEDFRAASTADPKQGQAWYWQGVVLLAQHQLSRVEQLANIWDKALSLGSAVAISACHERGLQVCERGDLILSAKSIIFSKGNDQIFNVPADQTAAGKFFNNAPYHHVTYSFKVGGKNFNFDFVPSNSSACKVELFVQCADQGYVEQLLLAQYVAQTLPRLEQGFGAQPSSTAASTSNSSSNLLARR